MYSACRGYSAPAASIGNPRELNVALANVGFIVLVVVSLVTQPRRGLAVGDAKPQAA